MTRSIRKRGDKWYYSFEASTIEGKRKRIERVGGKTKKEADSALRQALMEFENTGLHFEPAELSVSDHMDYWIENYVKINCKHTTQVSYTSVVSKHIKTSLGQYKIKHLSSVTLQNFINQKSKDVGKRTIEITYQLLKKALDYAVQPCQFIKTNPMANVRLPKLEQPQAKNKIIDNTTLEQILTKYSPTSDYYIPLLIGYHTGCRIGEILSLTWENLDFQNKAISISKNLYKKDGCFCLGTPKNNSSIRTVQIGDSLIKILKTHKAL